MSKLNLSPAYSCSRAVCPRHRIRASMIRFTAAASLALCAGMLCAGAPAELAMHWAMEPWTEDTDVLDTDVVGAVASLENFPEDGSEWATGVLGRALLFDGVNRHVAQNASLPRVQGTIGHWLRPSTATGTRVALYESDFPGGGATDYNGFGSAGAALEIHTGIFDGDYYAIWQDGPDQRQVRGGTATAGEWTHVALTWRIPGEMKLYVNCEEVDSVAMDVAFEGRAATEHFLGKPSQFGGRHWPGAMDEVKVWDREFNAQGVRSHFCPELQPETAVVRAQPPIASDRFGDTVALSGEWLLVRSPGASEVSWYLREGATGLQFDSSQSSDFTDSLMTGLATAKPLGVSGSLAAVADANDVDVYALGGSPAMAWSLATTLSDPSADNFGYAIAVSGDRVAVGAPTFDGGGAYVFERDQGGANAWGATFITGPGVGDELVGRLMDMDGDLLAVYSQSVSLTSITDVIDVYRRDLFMGNPVWAPESTITADGNTIVSLAVRGGRVATGVVDPTGEQRGVVIVRHRNQGGPDQWNIEHVFTASDADTLDRLGTEVAWLNDDTLVAVAPGTDRDHRAIYLFRTGGPFIQSQDTILVPKTFDPITENSDSVSTSLTATTDLIVAGTPFTGFAVTVPPSAPFFSGRLQVFVPIQVFADGFESDDT